MILVPRGRCLALPQSPSLALLLGSSYCIIDTLNNAMTSLFWKASSILGIRLVHVVHKMTPQTLVLCGPSGVGKSTLLKKLLEEFGPHFGFSVSHTTRSPREGEEHGKHYYFVTRQEMEDAVNNGDFIEHAEYSGNLYGTSKTAVQDVLENGRICILDIETQGVIQVKKTDLPAQFIFIRPPSIEDLEKRLQARGTETEESLKKRLGIAEKELKFGEIEGNFDKVIVNDDVDEAYEQLRDFMLPAINKKNGD